MGLAASQARFLAITARKNNCEFQSMQIAQEKLSVTRDLQRAAQEYENSLDATKLIWETTDGYVYDLSYATLMTPSSINEYQPYLITDTKGKVVLSEEAFNAIYNLGMIDEDGNPVSDWDGDHSADLFTAAGRNAFIDALGAAGQISASNATTVKNNGYDKTAGVGGDIVDTTTASAMTTASFLNYLKNAQSGYVQTLSQGSTSSYQIVLSGGSVLSALSENTTGSDINYYVINAGEEVPQNVTGLKISAGTKVYAGCTGNDSSGSSVTLKEGDTADKDITVSLSKGDKAPISFGIQTSKAAGTYATSSNQYSFCDTADSLLNELNNALGSIFTYSSNSAVSKMSDNTIIITKGSNYTKVSNSDLGNLTIADILTGEYEITIDLADNDNNADSTAENIAYFFIEMIAEIFGYDASGLVTGTGLNTDDEAAQALLLAVEFTKSMYSSENMVENGNGYLGDADQYNAISYKDSNNRYSINLSNLANTLLTYFAIALDGWDSAFTVDKKSANSTYATDDLNYYWVVANGGETDEQSMLIANYYNQLFNVICMYGCTTDKIIQQNVTDSSWLCNALKNGQLFISSLNTDGYFYQGAYTLNGYVSEVTDEDAVARAELEYEVTKSKLNSKEESLELDMKNLDTEISALTTEYDTVKNLISKNIEKVFTLFSS